MPMSGRVSLPGESASADFGAVTSSMFHDVPLVWPDVAARFRADPHWWIGTVGKSGPHSVPVWGVVVSEVLYFYGEADALRSRHISADHRIVLHLSDPMDVW